MTDTAASIQAEVVAGLQAEGLDVPFMLTKPGAPITVPTAEYPDASPSNQYPGAPVDYTAICQQVSAEYMQRQDMSLQASEIGVTVYGLAVEPNTGDAAVVFGKEMAVNQWQAKRFGAGAYAYLIKVGR